MKNCLSSILDGVIRAVIICALTNVFPQENWLIACAAFLVCLCLPAIAFVPFKLDPDLKTRAFFPISSIAFVIVFVLLLFTDNFIYPAREIYYGEALSMIVIMPAMLVLNCIGRTAAFVLINVKKRSRM